MALARSWVRYSNHVDTETVVGEGVFKTAYNFKGRPDLLVLLLTSDFEASEIEEEIKHKYC
jgi:hypothetical protein